MTMPQNSEEKGPVDWQQIDTVLLDMDGTLLDRHFDDYFWEHYVPEIFAAQNDITIAEAKRHLLSCYKGHEGTLAWTDLDFWSNQLDMDIPALKIKINHLIGVHPYVVDFLKFCRNNGKKVYLVTNAHSKTLNIKMQKTALAGYFDGIICAEEIGVAKEDQQFWARLEDKLGFDRARTLFADDTERVLDSAAPFGFGALIFVARPSSSKAVLHSKKYTSIAYFRELIANH